VLLPLLELLPALPASQAGALASAFGLGGEEVGNRFLASLATLGLLAEAAGDRALLCVVDDAHWLDVPTAEALLFAARRLEAEGVAMLLAARDGAARPHDRSDRRDRGRPAVAVRQVGGMVGALTMVLIGNPFSGVGSAPGPLPRPVGELGQLLPPGAGGNLLRRTGYFDGAGGSGHLLVLATWALFGIGALLASAVVARRRLPALAPAPA
jgi:hypothetical protein